MTLADPMDLPSLASLFRGEPHSLNVLRLSGINSPVLASMLNIRELRMLPGVGRYTADRIQARLEANGLLVIGTDESPRSFIRRWFGSVEQAPIVVLNALVVRDLATIRTMIAPLKVLLEMERYHPERTLFELAHMTRDQLKYEIENSYCDTLAAAHALAGDLYEVNHRMRWWDDDLCIGSGRSISTPTGRLEVVPRR